MCCSENAGGIGELKDTLTSDVGAQRLQFVLLGSGLASVLCLLAVPPSLPSEW